MSVTRRPPFRIRWSFALAALAVVMLGGAGGDAIGPTVLGLAIVLLAAQLGGSLAVRLGQPAVLGELLAGVVVGNLPALGLHWFPTIATNQGLETLAQLGVLILLFEVALDSSIGEMMQVGGTALAVAVVGVIVPFGLGWAVSAAVLPEHSAYVHAFLGATLTATSIGITARVLTDLGRANTAEARVILGAAVIDDVLGLITLAAVAGVIAAADAGRTASAGGIVWIGVKAVGFLVAALVIGSVLVPRLFRAAAALRGRGVLLVSALILCFGISYLAGAVGLAAVVGAFAAGLILERGHFVQFVERGEPHLDHLVHPLSVFLVPVFFVMMGAKVDVTRFADVTVLGLAGLLTVVGVVGKLAAGLAIRSRGIDRLAVGIGMVPRGEVGLIFANQGLALSVAGERIIDQGLFSAVVLMVILTTLMTPPALARRLRRRPAATG